MKTFLLLRLSAPGGLAGCDIPVATGSGVGTAMSVLVEAAILALQAGVLLHEAPEVE